MLKVTSGGNTNNLDSFLRTILKSEPRTVLDGLAQEGVRALAQATPKESGITSQSWSYEIVDKGGSSTLWFTNNHVVNGFNVAVGLQYGHGTGSGGWVAGYDYINPILKPIFDKIADNVWKEVERA